MSVRALRKTTVEEEKPLRQVDSKTRLKQKIIMESEKVFLELPKLLAFVEECANTLKIVFDYAGIDYSECLETTYASLVANAKELDSLTTKTLETLLMVIASNEHSLEPYQWEILHRDLSESYSERERLLLAFPSENTSVESETEKTDDTES